MTSPLFDGSLGGGAILLLVVSLTIALAFEFVNGFHDTANAVATVIYTKSLKPQPAVVWSGLCNFAGVALGGTAVAFGIVNLLPVDLLIQGGSGEGLAMVMALLIAAIIWNLGTWLLALPASSSHTLIGAIVGVGLANSALPGHSFGAGVNWLKLAEVGLSLLLSPVVGFTLSALLLLVFKAAISDPTLHEPARDDRPPPTWIRAVLITTCSGVSFAHGSNDGQKGIGLIMLILIGIIPAHYAINPATTPAQLRAAERSVGELDGLIGRTDGTESLRRELADLGTVLGRSTALKDLPTADRLRLRSDLLHMLKSLEGIKNREGQTAAALDWRAIDAHRVHLQALTEYAPRWVMIAVATALGVGTTVGWKRIVKTIGEKIGKTHLTYAQGACAEIVAMTTIGLADVGGLPVSTTHVLSSGVAGTMAANRSGLQWKTVRNIVLAWVLTLPVSMLLAGGLFLTLRPIFASRG